MMPSRRGTAFHRRPLAVRASGHVSANGLGLGAEKSCEEPGAQECGNRCTLIDSEESSWGLGVSLRGGKGRFVLTSGSSRQQTRIDAQAYIAAWNSHSGTSAGSHASARQQRPHYGRVSTSTSLFPTLSTPAGFLHRLSFLHRLADTPNTNPLTDITGCPHHSLGCSSLQLSSVSWTSFRIGNAL